MEKIIQNPMKEKIFAHLKTKLEAFGVPNTYLDGVAETYSRIIKDEKDIEALIDDKALEIIKFSAGHIQVEADKRTTTAIKKIQQDEELAKRPVGRPPKKKEEESDEEPPAWVTKLLEKQEQKLLEMEAKFTKAENEKRSSSLQGQVIEKLKAKGIPERFFKGRNLIVESEDGIDQLVTSVESDFIGFKQEQAEQGVHIAIPPTGGGTVIDAVTINDYLDQLPKPTNNKIPG